MGMFLESCRQYLLGGSVGASSPFTVAKALGSEIWDTTGKRYIDCTAQAWSLSLGHSHPRIVKAVTEHLKSYGHIRTSFDTEPKLLLAKKLTELAPGMKKVAFYLSGSEAVEGAIKLAIRNNIGERRVHEVLALEEGFHGRTFGTMSLSWPHPGNPFHQWMGPVKRMPGAYCYRCPVGRKIETCDYECIGVGQTRIGNMSPTALIMEPFPGNGGMIKFPPLYLQKMRDWATEIDTLLIFDEIQTGIGRLGDWFASTLYKVTPDIMVIGEGLGGGFPIFAVLASDKIKNGFQPGDHSFTFAHFSPSMVAALETIAIIEETSLLNRVTEMGVVILERLKEMQNEFGFIGDVRGEGLMIGIEIVKEWTKIPAPELAHELVQRAIQHGVIFGESKYGGLGNVIKIKPPLNIPHDQMDEALDVLENLFNQVRTMR
jgi:4-aminobutyrate aminotransferase-like enzyme